MTAPMPAPMPDAPTGPLAGTHAGLEPGLEPGPSAPSDRFEIRTDRAAVYRRVKRGLQWQLMGAFLLVGAACGGFMAALGSAGIAPSVLLPLGFSFGMTVVMATVTWMLRGPVTWLLRREMPVPLVADPQGVWMAVPGTAEGFVRLPWWAVRSITVRGRGDGKAVVIAVRTDVPPTAPGVGGLTDGVAISAARRGIVVSTYGTNVTARTAAAVLDQYARAASGGVPT